MYTKFKKVVLGLLGHVTPKLFLRRILRRTLKFTIHIVFRTAVLLKLLDKHCIFSRGCLVC